jgi:hypothetical protein
MAGISPPSHSFHYGRLWGGGGAVLPVMVTATVMQRTLCYKCKFGIYFSCFFPVLGVYKYLPSIR